MQNRNSYSGLMNLPAYGLYSSYGKLIATVRANTADDADVIFDKYDLHGDVVRLVNDPWTKIWQRLNASGA